MTNLELNFSKWPQQAKDYEEHSLQQAQTIE